MDGVSLVIDLISSVHGAYKNFKALQDENEKFRQSMLAVRGVLVALQNEDGLVSNASLSLDKPLKLIEQGVLDGKKVMEKCSRRKNKLLLLLASEDYVDKLKRAGTTMNEGLAMVSAIGVTIQSDIRGQLEDAQQCLRSMQCELENHESDVTDILLNMVMPSVERIPDEVVSRLRDMNVVSSEEDCVGQIREIQQDAELRAHGDHCHGMSAQDLDEKNMLNEQLLQWALHVSLPPSIRPQMDEEIEKILTCPLSLELVRDPVTLVQTGQTYDRKSLCDWLLQNPAQCAVTKETFHTPLQYIDNNTARQLLALYLGDDAYQQYDDSEFGLRYATICNKTGSAECCSADTYEKIGSLLIGLNQLKVDWEVANQLLGDAGQEDAIVAGFRALILHPDFGDSRPAGADETKSRCEWERAENLGIKDSSKGGNIWAQALCGIYCVLSQEYSQAKQLCQLAAARGSSLAQSYLGKIYHHGLGVPQDYKMAICCYELAVGQGAVIAQNGLATLYLDAQVGGTGDQVRAYELFTLAAEQGDGFAQYNVGFCYENGRGIQKSFIRARLMYELASERGIAIAQFRLANLHYHGRGTPVDYAQASHFYELAVKQGDTDSQLALGDLNLNGKGVPKNFERARELFELASSQGNATAQYRIGTMYEYGKGVRQDYVRARHYFELAADRGNSSAQYSLCYLYQNGLGVETDFERAKHFCQLAVENGIDSARVRLDCIECQLDAERGDSDAQCTLAEMYCTGKVVSKDYDRGRKLYELASDQGNATALYRIGSMYYHGKGVEQDFEMARHYYEQAAAKGVADVHYELGVMFQNGLGGQPSFEQGWKRCIKRLYAGEILLRAGCGPGIFLCTVPAWFHM